MQSTREKHKINCEQCEKKSTLRDNPEDLWDPGIPIAINFAKVKMILLVIKVKNAKIISDVYAKGKLLQEMDANMPEIDAKLQGLLAISKDIRDGWIETVQLIADTIQNRAMQEEDAKTEVIADKSIRDVALTAIRTASIAADAAKTAGAGPITAIFMAEEAGVDAAIASIRAASAQAKAARDDATAAAAVRREIAMAEVASASIRAAAVQINENSAAIRAVAEKAKYRAAARATAVKKRDQILQAARKNPLSFNNEPELDWV